MISTSIALTMLLAGGCGRKKTIHMHSLTTSTIAMVALELNNKQLEAVNSPAIPGEVLSVGRSPVFRADFDGLTVTGAVSVIIDEAERRHSDY
ncbi:hypothetical protein [Enterobacter roggenkampii]|uniref:hypothetical protein n=1 Tax=Enterobacter roggenkampii TaxID=1812935 RepID=UPI00107EB820|nr:hypothetical protein [Enterobacter roggenkampii]QBX83407.1 hypothetical protein E4005_00495 [Enterobacter roggenkampii]